MVKSNEINTTATFAWSNAAIPVLATGSAAGVIDDDFSSTSSLQFYSLYDKTPILSVDADAKFYDLDWSKNNTLLAGALENGTIQFWNTDKLKSGSAKAVGKGIKHTGSVKTLQFNPLQHNVLVSGGSNGEIFLWDTNKLEHLSPFGPGNPMTPMDTITSVAWNHAVSHIFGAAGSAGYTSIWDLKSKKEVLHLTYTSPTGTRASLSTVQWHPSQSTKLITASESDGAPVILTWDLRNSNAPETILTGHSKGVLSLDWNAQDPSFLLSCGKDNTTMLWNPLTGDKLAEYPTTANWAFKTRFAPAAPDVFATSSFDKKVIIQTLQDTSPPVSTRISTVKDSDFWNEISTTDTQQPKYFVKQAPGWYGSHSSVSFGFGAKLVTVSKTGDKTSEIKISKVKLPGSTKNENLEQALETGDFKPIIESRLASSFDDINKADWELLEKLAGGDIYEKFIALEISDGDEVEKDTASSGEDFYDNVKAPKKFAPSGELKFSGIDSALTNALLTKNFEKAVDLLLKEGNLTEALVIALSGPESLKKKVSDYYFSENGDKSPLSRLLYNVSSADVTDLVENGDLSNWREIGTAIKTYSANDAVYKTQFTRLGDRMLQNKDRNDAILNYVNASALNKVADVWNLELKELEKKILTQKNTSSYDAHFESLTEFIEKFSAYRATLNLDAPVSEGSSSLSTLLEYIDIISTSGQFELASKILSLVSSDLPAVKLEQARIQKATSTPAKTAARQTTATRAGNRYGSIAQGYSLSQATGMNNTISGSSGIPPNVATPSVGQTSQQRGRSVVNPYATSGAPAASVAAVPPPAPIASATPSYGLQPPAPGLASAGHSPYSTVVNPALPVNAGVPSYGAPTNPYMPSATTPVPTPTQAPPLPKNARKVETDGWNDLPVHFHKQHPVRRPAPVAAASAAVPSGSSSNGTNSPMSRTTSYTNAQALPPPPRSMSRPKPPVEPTPVHSNHSHTSRYAPASPKPNVPSLSSPSHSAAVLSGPPKNPYAPSAAPVAPVSNPYAPTNGGINPPNPYGAPQVGGVFNNAASASHPPHHNQYGAPPTTNAYAPPSAYGAPAVATSHNAYGVPPTAGPPPRSFGAPPKSGPSAAKEPVAEPAPEPVKERYPVGDRSHIPPEQKRIYETLERVLQDVNAAGLPDRFSKQVADTEKRLNILFDHLNNQELLTPPTIELLGQLCDRLNEKDAKSAADLHLQIVTHHPDEGGHWAVGVKKLISFADAAWN